MGASLDTRVYVTLRQEEKKSLAEMAQEKNMSLNDFLRHTLGLPRIKNRPGRGRPSKAHKP